MELISFGDILKAVRPSLIQGCYKQSIIEKWDSEYAEGSLALHWQSYVDDVQSLCSFLRSVIGIEGDTEHQIVLRAVTIAFRKPFKFGKPRVNNEK